MSAMATTPYEDMTGTNTRKQWQFPVSFDADAEPQPEKPKPLQNQSFHSLANHFKLKQSDHRLQTQED